MASKSESNEFDRNGAWIGTISSKSKSKSESGLVIQSHDNQVNNAFDNDFDLDFESES